MYKGRNIFFALIVFLSSSIFVNGQSFEASNRVVLDTDMGNALDDLWALDVLMHPQSEMDGFSLLSVMVNHDIELAVPTIKILNTWYGYEKTPVGMVNKGVADSRIFNDYCSIICGNSNRNLTNENTVEAVSLYRKLLSAEKDSSVTIVSVGFFTNLSRLLQSPPDEYSPLNGMELVKKKVKTMIAMCGSTEKVDYNIRNDLSSARVVFEQWPTTISIVPSETKLQLSVGKIIKELDRSRNHPLMKVFQTINPKVINNCWDGVASLACVSNFEKMTCSNALDITLDDQGVMIVNKSIKGKFRIVTLSKKQMRVQTRNLYKIIGRR